uniref:Uncharacterized protein n=1 Tax=Panagrolaimus sp. PS1159 TaxID=55785 RepID=A0AC35EZE6_9BILA
MRWVSPGLDIHFDLKRSFLMYEKNRLFIGKILASKECHCYSPFFETKNGIIDEELITALDELRKAYLQRPHKNIYYLKF